jgi:hypothetical protein
MPRSTRPSSSKFRARLAPKRMKNERKKRVSHCNFSTAKSEETSTNIKIYQMKMRV